MQINENGGSELHRFSQSSNKQNKEIAKVLATFILTKNFSNLESLLNHEIKLLKKYQ